MVSSGLLRLVALVRTDVSEEPGSSFIRVTNIGELGTTQAATSNGRTLRRNISSQLRIQNVHSECALRHSPRLIAFLRKRCCVLCAVCCLLCAVCCVLCAVCCVLFAVCCVLCAVCCVLCAVCCLLFAVCCLLCAVWCLLFAVCCVLCA
jgi:hypothetical protein